MKRKNVLIPALLFFILYFELGWGSSNCDCSSTLPRRKAWEKAIQNLRYSLDLSSRVAYNSRLADFAFTQFVGIDTHKVFVGDQGDCGTAVIQLYATHVEWPGAMKPFFFDKNHTLKLIPRVCTFNYTGFPGSRGLFNIKVGHFEIPFGLEFTFDTNGSLHDFMHRRNLGVKLDWGFTINGVDRSWEYEIGLSRGSGIDYTSRGEPWMVAGRVGRHINRDLRMGTSFLWGEVLNAPSIARYRSGLTPAELLTDNRGRDHLVRKYRLGTDVQWTCGLWMILLELTGGKDFSQAVVNNLLEINRVSMCGDWFFYGQVLHLNQKFSVGWEDSLSAKLGAQWTPDRHWDLSTQFEQQIRNFFGGSRAGILQLQVRWRY